MFWEKALTILDQLNSIVNTKKIDEVEVMVVFAVTAVVVTTFLLGVQWETR
jgi:hypothetical protein